MWIWLPEETKPIVAGKLEAEGDTLSFNYGKSYLERINDTPPAISIYKPELPLLGATMDNIVDETFFVTDMNALTDNLEAIYAERESAYGGMPEVSQTVFQVGALVQPELKIEIRCIAHL